MKDIVLHALYLLVAVGIVGGGLYLLLDKAAPIVAVQPAMPEQSAAPASAPRPYEPSSAPAEPRSGSAIYRCDQGGSAVYSDNPCTGGRVVDVQVTQGFQAEQYRLPASMPRQAPVAATPRTPAIAQANGTVEERLCAEIDRAIEAVEAAARRGGSIQYMEDLKERRRRLVEQRQQLRC